MREVATRGKDIVRPRRSRRSRTVACRARVSRA